MNTEQAAAILKAFEANEPRDELEGEIYELSVLELALNSYCGKRVDVSEMLDATETALQEVEQELAELDKAADEKSSPVA